MNELPLLIEFVAGTSLYRERDLAQSLPIVHNGPPGAFVVFPDGLRVSLPTDSAGEMRARCLCSGRTGTVTTSTSGTFDWHARASAASRK